MSTANFEATLGEHLDILAKHCEAKLTIHKPRPGTLTYVMSQASSDAFLTIEVTDYAVEIWGTVQAGSNTTAETVRRYLRQEDLSTDEVFENVKDWITAHWWSDRPQRKIKISLDFEVTLSETARPDPVGFSFGDSQQAPSPAINNIVHRLVHDPSAHTIRRDLASLAVLDALEQLSTSHTSGDLSIRLIREPTVEAIIAPIVASLSSGDQKWVDAQRRPHGEWYDEVESRILSHVAVRLLGIRS